MQIRSLLAAAALAAVSVACGGGGASVTVNGNLRGQAMKAGDAISAPATIQTGAGPASVGAIVITNSGGLCAKVGANQEPKNSQFLLIFLGELSNTTGSITAPTSTGTYTVYAGASGTLPPSKLAIVVYSATDATCKDNTGGTNGISGTVVLTGNSNGAYTGTFDITVQSQDTGGSPSGSPEHVTGSFSASNCAGLSTLITQNRTTTCI